jgi:hypothetical protein
MPVVQRGTVCVCVGVLIWVYATFSVVAPSGRATMNSVQPAEHSMSSFNQRAAYHWWRSSSTSSWQGLGSDDGIHGTESSVPLVEIQLHIVSVDCPI